MQFTTQFEVPLVPLEAWPLLLDIERMVPCMPGAELIEKVDQKTFKGKVSVRLGPVALTFVCLATFEEIDNDAYTARIRSQGADAKGRGNANAVICFQLESSEKGSKATIVTDLNLSGTVAQYGRGAGMIQSVANQIVTQFAKNLEAQVEAMKGAAPTVRLPQVQASLAIDPLSPTRAEGGVLAPAPAAGSPVPAMPRPIVKPISGFTLMWSVVKQSLAGWFRGVSRK